MSQKPDQWKYEDDVDSQMAIDINRDRNMMDYVLYNENGIAFVTLAGIMKVANERNFTTEVCEITRSTHSVEAIVKVTAPPDPDKTTENDRAPRSAWSGREEYLKDGNGRPDKFAITKAINIATKNACKTLLYGDSYIELMLTEFVRDNAFVPPPKPQSKPASAKQPEPAKQQQAKPAAAKKDETWQDKARDLWVAGKEDFEKMNVHDEEISEVFRMWNFYFNLCAPEDVAPERWQFIHDTLKEKDYGIIGKFYREPPDDFREVLGRHNYKPAEKGSPETETETKSEQAESQTESQTETKPEQAES